MIWCNLGMSPLVVWWTKCPCPIDISRWLSSNSWFCWASVKRLTPLVIGDLRPSCQYGLRKSGAVQWTCWWCQTCWAGLIGYKCLGGYVTKHLCPLEVCSSSKRLPGWCRTTNVLSAPNYRADRKSDMSTWGALWTEHPCLMEINMPFIIIVQAHCWSSPSLGFWCNQALCPCIEPKIQ